MHAESRHEAVAPGEHTFAQDAPRAELGLGYQYLRTGFIDETVSLAAGLNGDVAVSVTNAFSIVGELGWGRTGDAPFFDTEEATFSATNFAGGLRWSSRTDPRVTPFAQVLVGGQREVLTFLGDSASMTNLILQAGAGVSLLVGETWGVFGQADYRHISHDDDTSPNAFRVVVGARFVVR